MPLGAVYHTHCAAVKTSFRPPKYTKKTRFVNHSATIRVHARRRLAPTAAQALAPGRSQGPFQHLPPPSLPTLCDRALCAPTRKPGREAPGPRRAGPRPRRRARRSQPGPPASRRAGAEAAARNAGERAPPAPAASQDHGHQDATHQDQPEQRPPGRHHGAAGHCTAAFKKRPLNQPKQRPPATEHARPEKTGRGQGGQPPSPPQRPEPAAPTEGEARGQHHPQGSGRASAAPGATAPEGAAPLPLGGWKGIHAQRTAYDRYPALRSLPVTTWSPISRRIRTAR